jgi:hypothetical protein
VKRVVSLLLAVSPAIALAMVVLVACSSTESTPEVADAGEEVASPRRDAVAPDASEEPDAATKCEPAALKKQPAWHPPKPQAQGACSLDQIEGYVTSCYNSPKQSVCDAFAAQNDACFKCVESKVDDTSWGPLVWYEGHSYVKINGDGCVAHAFGDTSTDGCGAAFLLYDECARLACSGCAPVTTQRALDALFTCQDDYQHVDEICAAERANANVKCTSIKSGDAGAAQPAIDRCYGKGLSFEDLMRVYMKLWCMPAETDGGADAGDGG